MDSNGQANNAYPEYLSLAIDYLDQGFSIFNADLELVAWNHQFHILLRFPEELCVYGTSLESFFRHNAERGEYGEGDVNELVASRLALAHKGEAHCFERVCPDGSIIEITGKPMPDGSFVTTYTDITIRKRAEQEKLELLDALEQRVLERTQELQKKTRLLEVTLENIGQGISMIDTDLNVSVTNQKLVEVLDLPDRFAEPGTPFEDVMRYNAERGEYGPGDVEKLVQERLELARNAAPHVVTRTLLSGKTIEIAGQPLAEGGFVTTYTDITEQTQILQHLKENEEQLRAILDNASAVIYLKHVDGSYITVNTLYETVFNQKREDIIGKTDYALFPEDMADGFRKNDLKVLELGHAMQFEEQTNQEDGLHEYISIKFPLFNDQHEPYAICSISTDITERNRSQEQLRQLRSYLQNVVDSMPSAVIGIDAGTIVTQWNREAELMLGIKKEVAIGQPIHNLHSDILPRQETLLASLKALKTTTFRQKLVNTSSIPKHLEITIYPLEDFATNGAVIRIDDVSKRVRLEEVMIQSEKMLSVGGLAAGMAHEINNPLAGILQNAQVLKNRLDSNMHKNRETADALNLDIDLVQDYLVERSIFDLINAIRDAGGRASNIVKNMLSFSRKDSSKPEHSDLESLIKKTIDLAANDFDLKKQYDFKQINIKQEYTPNLPPAYCSPNKIQQVILNLLKNSAEAMAMAEQAGDRNISINLGMDKDRIKLVIKDNGPGMKEETRKRIFEPFFTTKGAGVGTGLGLSISYFIITEDHQGEMWVDSIPGHGATFTILLNTPP